MSIVNIFILYHVQIAELLINFIIHYTIQFIIETFQLAFLVKRPIVTESELMKHIIYVLDAAKVQNRNSLLKKFEKKNSKTNLQLIDAHSVSNCGIDLMTFAGLPAAIVHAGTSFETKEPAPIMAPSPMVTPGKTMDSIPTKQPFFKTMGLMV